MTAKRPHLRRIDLPPIQAVLRRYQKDHSIAEIAREVDATRGAVSQLFNGTTDGLKPYNGSVPLFYRVSRYLRIPEREVRRVVADTSVAKAMSAGMPAISDTTRYAKNQPDLRLSVQAAAV